MTTIAPLYTVTQAAATAGVSRQLVWLAIKAGTIPASKYGKYYLIEAKALEAWLESRKKGDNEDERN